MGYKGYSEPGKKATMRYLAEKQKQIVIRYKKEEYESRIQPAVEQSGLPLATFFKKAVEEKIFRDYGNHPPGRHG